MEYKEYRTIDKSKWPRGEWDNEPDKVQFVDEVTGLPCIARRHLYGGNWCGYVGVAPGHPTHGKYLHDIEYDFTVHDGVSYAQKCEVAPEDTGICHVPDIDDPDHIWWLGFSCGTFYDMKPGMDATFSTDMPEEIRRYWNGKEYRNLDYVKSECATLAAQLKAYENQQEG